MKGKRGAKDVPNMTIRLSFSEKSSLRQRERTCAKRTTRIQEALKEGDHFYYLE